MRNLIVLSFLIILAFVSNLKAQNKILLSEFVVAPTVGEFVEIYNPGDSIVDLSNYYITDATFQNGNTYFYQIVLRNNPEIQGGGGNFSDWHAKFPDGATIDPQQFQTISLNGSSNFFAEYGLNPTYELYEDSVSADTIPDMIEADSGSINAQGGLTSAGEFLVLYYWDGNSDLVTDVDYIVWGDKVEAVDKSGIRIDGPDADSDSSIYTNNIAISNQEVSPTHIFTTSAQRIHFDEGTQTTKSR